MKAKNTFYLFCISCFVLLSCAKDDFYKNLELEGKVIYVQKEASWPYDYYIKDLKTKNLNKYTGLPLLSNKGDKVALYKETTATNNYYAVLVTDISGTETFYSFNEPSFSVTNMLWSPNDNQLAILSYEKNNIRIYDFTTQKVSKIYLPGGEVFKNFIKWSGKDDFLYFMSKNSKKELSVGKIKPDGTGYQTVFRQESHHLIGSSYDYDENADLIMFNYFDSTKSEVKIVSIHTDGSEFKTLYSKYALHSGWILDINISPDGKQVLYGQSTGLLDVYVMDIDGGNNKLFWKQALHPQWSKDGTIAMANVRYYMDWNTSKWDIRVKKINQDGEEETIINGPVTLISWITD